MLTIPQVAAQFGVDPSLVTKWCKNGTLPNAIKQGGKWSIPETDVDALAAKRQMSRVCARCGKEFTAWHPNGQYCSKRCYRSASMERRYRRKRADGLCPRCLRNPSPNSYVLCDGCRARDKELQGRKTAEQRARAKQWKKNWLSGKPDYYHETGQKYRDKLRRQVFEHYGNRCACCGLEDWRFLTIDHIDGKGNQHRRDTFNGRLVAGSEFYRWLRSNNYPEGFQLLCYNCNCVQSRFMGICPHKLDQIQANSVLDKNLIE